MEKIIEQLNNASNICWEAERWINEQKLETNTAAAIETLLHSTWNEIDACITLMETHGTNNFIY